MIVRGLFDKTDAEVMKMVDEIGNEPAEWTPILLSELTRRSVVRLLESSRRIEKLTRWLIILTVVLFGVALPPAIEVASKYLTTQTPKNATLEAERFILKDANGETRGGMLVTADGPALKFYDSDRTLTIVTFSVSKLAESDHKG